MLFFKTLKTAASLFLLSVLIFGCGATTPTGPAAVVPEEDKALSPDRGQVISESSIPAQTSPPGLKKAEESLPGTAEPLVSEPDPLVGELDIFFDYADIEFVQHRLIVYENKFEQLKSIAETETGTSPAEETISLTADCTQKLKHILDSYRSLMQRLQEQGAQFIDLGTEVDFKELQQHDIRFLEGRCNELIAMQTGAQWESAAQAKPELSFTEMEQSIADLVAAGKYQEALLTYSNLTAEFPGRKPSLKTRFSYGRALKFTGQIEAAARHYQSLLVSGDLDFNPLSIQREIADLLLAGADTEAAESYYNSLIQKSQSLDDQQNWAREQLAFLQSIQPESEELLAYMKLLREFLTRDYKMYRPGLNEMVNNFAREYAGSPAAVSALRLKTFAMDQLKSWFGRQLVRVDRLVEEKKFTEATDLLNTLSSYSLPADLQVVLQKTLFDVTRAEILDQENQRFIQKMDLTNQWNSAVNLLESQQYDAAISAFTTFADTEYGEQAKLKIIEAANQAAGEMRKEAASLFIRAGKTSDLEYKKNLLLDSYNLLTDILVKYPQTELLEKVKQNIAILEEQIERLDPALLEELHRNNSADISAEAPKPGPDDFRR